MNDNINIDNSNIENSNIENNNTNIENTNTNINKVDDDITDIFPALKEINIVMILKKPKIITGCHNCKNTAIFFFQVDVKPYYLHNCQSCLTDRCWKCNRCRRVLTNGQLKKCIDYHYDYCSKCLLQPRLTDKNDYNTQISNIHLYPAIISYNTIIQSALISKDMKSRQITFATSSLNFKHQVYCSTHTCNYRARWMLQVINQFTIYVCNSCLHRQLIRCMDCYKIVNFYELSDLTLCLNMNNDTSIKPRCADCMTQILQSINLPLTIPDSIIEEM